MIWDPEQLIKLAHDMNEPRERYLKWKAVVDRYDRGRDTKLGEIRSTLDRQGKTQDDLKYETRSHQEFVKYLEEWRNAEEQMIKAKVEYDNLQCAFDAYQSALSYQREHLKRLGG